MGVRGRVGLRKMVAIATKDGVDWCDDVGRFRVGYKLYPSWIYHVKNRDKIKQ